MWRQKTLYNYPCIYLTVRCVSHYNVSSMRKEPCLGGGGGDDGGRFDLEPIVFSIRWNIFFHLLICNTYMPIQFRCFSCKQHMNLFCFYPFWKSRSYKKNLCWGIHYIKYTYFRCIMGWILKTIYTSLSNTKIKKHFFMPKGIFVPLPSYLHQNLPDTGNHWFVFCH